MRKLPTPQKTANLFVRCSAATQFALICQESTKTKEKKSKWWCHIALLTRLQRRSGLIASLRADLVWNSVAALHSHPNLHTKNLCAKVTERPFCSALRLLDKWGGAVRQTHSNAGGVVPGCTLQFALTRSDLFFLYLLILFLLFIKFWQQIWTTEGKQWVFIEPFYKHFEEYGVRKCNVWIYVIKKIK